MSSNSDNVIFDCLDLLQVNRLPTGPKEILLNDHNRVDGQRRINHMSNYYSLQKVAKINHSHPIIQPFSQQQQPTTTHTIAQEDNERSVHLLQCSEEIRKHRQHLGKKGRMKQTQNMGKRYKTITAAFLSMLSQAKCLSQPQLQAIKVFSSCNGSLRDFQELFESQKLRKLCRDFFSSKDYISFILRSTKMDMRNKLMMVKHSQKLHSLTYNHITGWKLHS